MKINKYANCWNNILVLKSLDCSTRIVNQVDSLLPCASCECVHASLFASVSFVTVLSKYCSLPRRRRERKKVEETKFCNLHPAKWERDWFTKKTETIVWLNNNGEVNKRKEFYLIFIRGTHKKRRRRRNNNSIKRKRRKSKTKNIAQNS